MSLHDLHRRTARFPGLNPHSRSRSTTAIFRRVRIALIEMLQRCATSKEPLSTGGDDITSKWTAKPRGISGASARNRPMSAAMPYAIKGLFSSSFANSAITSSEMLKLAETFYVVVVVGVAP